MSINDRIPIVSSNPSESQQIVEWEEVQKFFWRTDASHAIGEGLLRVVQLIQGIWDQLLALFLDVVPRGCASVLQGVFGGISNGEKELGVFAAIDDFIVVEVDDFEDAVDGGEALLVGAGADGTDLR